MEKDSVALPLYTLSEAYALPAAWAAWAAWAGRVLHRVPGLAVPNAQHDQQCRG